MHKTCIANAASTETVGSTQPTDLSEPDLQEEDNTNKANDILTDIIVPVALEFLGAFLGVLVALGSSAHGNKKQYKKLNESLYNELLMVEKDLKTRFSEKQDYYRYATPVWDINLAAGNLSILANRHVDKKYIEIYSKIQYAQELEREYIHSKLQEEHGSGDFLKSYIATINGARVEEANEIMKMILEIKSKEVKKCQV